MGKSARQRRAARARREAREFEMGYVGPEEAVASDQEEGETNRFLVLGTPGAISDEEETKEEAKELVEPVREMIEVAEPVQETTEAAGPVSEAVDAVPSVIDVFPSSAAIGWRSKTTPDHNVPQVVEMESVPVQPTVLVEPTGWQMPMVQEQQRSVRPVVTATHPSSVTRPVGNRYTPAPTPRHMENRYGPNRNQPRDRSRERGRRSRSREKRDRRSEERRSRSRDQRRRSPERMTRSPSRRRGRSLPGRSRSGDRKRTRVEQDGWDGQMREVLDRTLGVVKEHQQTLGSQSARMETLEKQLMEEHAARMVDLENRFEDRLIAERQHIKDTLMDGHVILPPVPERGLGKHTTRIKTKELQYEKYSPANGVPIEPFLRRFEETIVSMEERYECVWDDKTCYRQLCRALLGDAELFVASEDVVPLVDKTYSKFRLRLARRFGQVVHQTKWQAAGAMSLRMKKPDETYADFAAALEKLGGIHDIDREHFATCFKQGLNSLDRAQLPSVAHLSLAQCVHKLTIANGHDGKNISGWVPVNVAVPTVTPPLESSAVTAEVLAATVVRQFQYTFARGKGGWRPRGFAAGTGRVPNSSGVPGSNSEKSKQNRLTHIKCFSCQEFGHYESDCPKKAKMAADVAAFMAMVNNKDSTGNVQPDQE